MAPITTKLSTASAQGWLLLLGAACALALWASVPQPPAAHVNLYSVTTMRPTMSPHSTTLPRPHPSSRHPMAPRAVVVGGAPFEPEALTAQTVEHGGWAVPAAALMVMGASIAAAASLLQTPRPEIAMAAAVSSNKLNCRIVSMDEPGYKIIGNTEIPAAIPRDQLIDSIQDWAANEVRENLEQDFLDFKVQVDYEGDQITTEDTYSLTIRFTSPSGDFVVLELCLDNETFKVARTIEGYVLEDKERKILQADGTPDPRSLAMMGTESEVQGRRFIVRRKEGPMPDELRPVLGEFLKQLGLALTRYYAFGSLFLDDAM